jgi:hypothetical protein
MNKRLFCLLITVFNPLIAFSQSVITLSGYVREAGSDELLPYVTVRVAGHSVGTTANRYGYYTVTIPTASSTGLPQSLTLVASSVGFSPTYEVINSYTSQTRTIHLVPSANLLDEVAVVTQQERLSEQSQMSQISVPLQQIKQMPVLLGEKDVMKALQLLPGVQKGNEGQTGLYVRGGGPDQNLILLDDAIIYNVSHLFGFFSIFNNDAIKSVELTKGGFPARYGGRISSVVDIQMKEGNRNQLQGEASIGVLAGRLLLEGPLTRKKPSSFLVSARRSFLDLLPFGLGAAPYFYDLNAKANVDFDQQNKLYISGYLGRDAFGGGSSGNKRGLNWGNSAATLRWNHVFSPTLFGNASLVSSYYRFKVYSEQGTGASQVALDYTSGIRDLTIKYDLDWLPNAKHTIRMGGVATNHRFTPNARVLRTQDRDTSNISQIQTLATEASLYVEDDIKVASWLRTNLGLRGVLFNVRDRTYTFAEPRASLAISPLRNWSFKASYSRMNQFINLLSNSGLGLPTDLWVPATDRIPPQQGWQLAAGVAHDIPDHNLILTVEGYYKEMQNLIGYKDGATFLAVDLDGRNDPAQTYQTNWESTVTSGHGRSYGAEILLQRKTGRLTGWLGYTLSWTIHQFADLNGGRAFYPKYDRRHDASIVLSYKLTPRIHLSANWVYGTGNNITIPLGKHTAASDVPQTGTVNYELASLNSDRYSFRVAPYHRLDLGVRFEKTTRRNNLRTWELSVYNVYNRVNPFYYTTRQDQFTNISQLYRVGLFPLIPSLNYSLKF